MKYNNPVVTGFYPDPSACEANGKYYLVNSSFEYFPGVPLFESEDLVNWHQIGHVLTRKSQVMLEGVRSSGGVFAPTIRYHQGRFYMVTNNNSTNENFYVYTDDIYGEWSDPIVVDQDGIDPSLLFDEGKVYFISNGTDDEGIQGVVQCEIDITTGAKLSAAKCLWKGSGGRYLESPHMYHIGDYYYLMAAEGGTEYGHMVTYARSHSPWGPFEDYAYNPVLTNRDKAPGIIQGIGHGDLVQGPDGAWHMLCLGFRQIHLWQAHHTLGRETFLVPVSFDKDGWFRAGSDGTAAESYEIAGDFAQEKKNHYTFENTDWEKDWIYLRHPAKENYEMLLAESEETATVGVGHQGDENCRQGHDAAVNRCNGDKRKLILHGSDITLDEVASPTFLGIRQKEFAFTLSVDVALEGGMAGVSVYACEDHHYDIFLREKTDEKLSDAALAASTVSRLAENDAINAADEAAQDAASEHTPIYEVICKLNTGDCKQELCGVTIPTNHGRLVVKAEPLSYGFYFLPEVDAEGDKELSLDQAIYLGNARSKYLSSEVNNGFTGVVLALFAVGENTAEFTHFSLQYE